MGVCFIYIRSIKSNRLKIGDTNRVIRLRAKVWISYNIRLFVCLICCLLLYIKNGPPYTYVIPSRTHALQGALLDGLWTGASGAEESKLEL